jgi:hypothetical protein
VFLRSKRHFTGRSRRHLILKSQFQLPFVFFFLVLFIGKNFFFVSADAGHAVATGPDALSR